MLTFLAQYVLTRAYASADAAYLQPFDHLKLPFNVLLGWLVFGFVPGRQHVARCRDDHRRIAVHRSP